MEKKLNNKKIFRNLLFILTLCVIITSYFILKKEQLVIEVKDKEINTNSYSKTIKDVLKENNICYDKDDIIYPSPNSKLKDYMNIKVTYVQQVTISEHERIDYKTEVKKDKTLAKGTEIVIQEGKEGRKTVVYKEVYYDNKLVSRVIDKEIIREKPVNMVVTKGTSTSPFAKKTINIKSNDYTIKDSNTNNMQGNKIRVSATAYSGGTITATGTRPKWGTIAVDPRIIPYGTKVYIPKFNMTFVAEDCGGGIKGNRIDIFMNSSSDCYNWGVRNIEIYILG